MHSTVILGKGFKMNDVRNEKTWKRIASLRTANEMTQLDLAILLSELTKRNKPLTIATISSWESGRRQPSADMYYSLAKVFRVTEEYLKGLTDDPNSHEIGVVETNKNVQYVPTADIEIENKELYLYDAKPLFISFKNHVHLDQWAIYNAQKKAFLLKDGLLNETDPSINKIYAMEPYYSYIKGINGKNTLTLARLLNLDSLFWVEMITSDVHICNIYNGWFKHNENKTCLINSIGLTLPYEGINVSYHVYIR